MRGNPLALAVALAISTFASSVVTPYLSPYFLLLGGNEVLVGAFWALSSFLNLLLILPGGYVADAMGRKRVLVHATLLTAVAFLLFSGSPYWAFLFIPQALVAIATLSNPARDAILADSMPEKRRSTGFALVFALSSVGWTFGPLVGGYFYDHGGILGIRYGFLFSAVSTSIAALVYHLFLKETLVKRESQQVSTKASKSFLSSLNLQRFLSEMGLALKQMTVPAKRFLVGYMFYEASGAIISAYWPLLLLYVMGFSGVELGFVELAAGLALIAFSIPMGKFSDRIGRPRAALLITVCSAAVLVWVVNSRLFVEVLLIGSLLDIFDPRPTIHGLRADVIPQPIRGRVISFFSVAGYAAATVSVSIGGLLYTVAPRLPFYVGAVFLAISGIFFAYTKPPSSDC
jgi:DHA1 family tetracycline resistance protein-like MFS transporter